eukprot:TRINITY_DN33139_c0_g1_i1.p1 TRINITY_DN33139_c0_g1~~TRINITY_DN33139_c0_g1_i1.p1  ORF type:complete len:708 (+),score=109.06 TRINITY_DN33139_c0_g1_i1:68-2125(+)
MEFGEYVFRTKVRMFSKRMLLIAIFFGLLAVQTFDDLQKLRAPSRVIFVLGAFIAAVNFKLQNRANPSSGKASHTSIITESQATAIKLYRINIVYRIVVSICLSWYVDAGPLILLFLIFLLPTSAASECVEFRSFLAYLPIHACILFSLYVRGAIDVQYLLAVGPLYPVLLETAYRGDDLGTKTAYMGTAITIIKQLMSLITDGVVLVSKDFDLLASDSKWSSLLDLAGDNEQEVKNLDKFLEEGSPSGGICKMVLGSFHAYLYTVKVPSISHQLSTIFGFFSEIKAPKSADEDVYLGVIRLNEASMSNVIPKVSDSVRHEMSKDAQLLEPLLAGPSDYPDETFSSVGSEFSYRSASARSGFGSSAVASIPCGNKTSWLSHGSASSKNTLAEMEDISKAVLGQAFGGAAREDAADSEVSWSALGERKALSPRFSFFGVFDGHGGTRAASFAKSFIIRQLANNPAELERDAEGLLRRSIHELEDQFMKLADKNDWSDGTTLAVVLLDGATGRIVCANVGDTEVLQGSFDPVSGKLLSYEMLSELHQPIPDSAEYARVKAAGGIISSGRVGHPNYNPKLFSLAISRSIGDPFYKLPQFIGDRVSGVICDPHIRRVQLEFSRSVRHFVLLASDGLWGSVDHHTVGTFVAERLAMGQAADSISNALSKYAMSKGSQDNITVQLLATESI